MTIDYIQATKTMMAAAVPTRVQEAVETIQQWTKDLKGMPELISDTPKEILIELLTEHRPSRYHVLFDTFSFADALAVMTLSILKLPIREEFINLLTNAIRVSENGFVAQFILSVISSSSDICLTETNKKLICTTITTPNMTTITKQDQRAIDSTLEYINHLRAEIYFSYPKEPALISPTCSTLTSSSSFSSLNASTTATSIFGYDDESKFHDESMDEIHAWSFKIDLDSVMQFKADFTSVKIKIQMALSHYDFIPTPQVNEALDSLITHCNAMQDRLLKFETDFIFTQLSQFVAVCIENSNNWFLSLGQRTVILKEDLDTLNHWVSSSLHLVHRLSEFFLQDEACTLQLTALIQQCDQLKKSYIKVKTVWDTVHHIKGAIEEGVDMLHSISLTDENLSQHARETSRYIHLIQDKVFNVTYDDLQTLVNDTVYNMKSCSGDTLDAYEKVKSTIIHSTFSQLQVFKRDMLDTIVIVEKFNAKQKIKKDIEKGVIWLQLFRGSLLGFGLENTLWCPFNNAAIRVEGLTELKHRYAQFTLTDYNNICSYFVQHANKGEYYRRRRILVESNELNYQQWGDAYLQEEYNWFNVLQELCEEVGHVLEFLGEIQQQQADVLGFIYQAELFTGCLLNLSDEPSLVERARVVYKDAFEKIKWPTYLSSSQIGCDFYRYSQTLYIKVSNVKINLIDACKNHKQ